MPPLFSSDSNFRLNYFGLKFYLLAAKSYFIFCPWLTNFWFYLPNPSPTITKVKGGGLLGLSPLYHCQSGHSCIFTARWIYTVCYLSVMTQCQYLGCVIISEGFMVFTIFKWIDLSHSNSHFIKSLNIPNFYGSGRRPPATNTLSWIGEYPFTTEK